MNKLYRGTITLSFLFTIVVLVIIAFWANQNLLTNYAKMQVAHQKSQKINWRLLQQSTDFKMIQKQCQQLKDTDNNIFQKTFSEFAGMTGNKNLEKLEYGVFCRFHSLLNDVPKKNILQQQWHYVNEKLLSPLQIMPVSQPLQLTSNQQIKVYYLNKPNNKIIVQGTVYALVLAKGNLDITGKGTLRGMIITQGKIYALKYNNKGDWVEDTQACQGNVTSHCTEKIRLIYDKSVQTLIKNLGIWRWQKGSWYDFNETD